MGQAAQSAGRLKLRRDLGRDRRLIPREVTAISLGSEDRPGRQLSTENRVVDPLSKKRIDEGGRIAREQRATTIQRP